MIMDVKGETISDMKKRLDKRYHRLLRSSWYDIDLVR